MPSDFSRRGFLGSSLGPIAAGAQSSTTAPNVLFLISDDHSQPDLGCYGNRTVATPHLDRLAASGARFTNCFVASPQCSPNRSAIFTGCSPHTTSTSRLHTPMPAWEPTFLEPLRERGYFTGAVRKLHQGPAFEKRFEYYESKPARITDFFDRLPKNRPFWFQVGFTDPHRPYKPGAFQPPHDPARVQIPPFLPDTPEVRTDLAHYYDFIARMDSECGQILSALEERGLAQNTMVVFTGDNGMPFPRAKGTCYDSGIRVPLLVRWPGRVQPGRVVDDLVSHVDLAPTWLGAAGLAAPAKMQGRNILDLLLGRGPGPRQAVFSERNWHDNFDPIRCVRTARHKLIFNAAPHFPYRPAWDLTDSPTWQAMLRESRRGTLPLPLRELFAPARPLVEVYDLERDPNEFHNLALSPDYQDVTRDLLDRLSQWMHETYDYLPPARSAPGEPAGRGWPVSL
jgi:arylsulfatase A-like enzyme